jgi:hypothetical protein
MDKFEKLAFESSIAAAVLGNVSTGDFQLVDVTSLPLSTEDQASFHARGFGFLGLLGVCDGIPHTALAVELDPTTTSALSSAFVQFVWKALSEKGRAQGKRDDGADWLRRLFSLPDKREEMN